MRLTTHTAANTLLHATPPSGEIKISPANGAILYIGTKYFQMRDHSSKYPGKPMVTARKHSAPPQRRTSVPPPVNPTGASQTSATTEEEYVPEIPVPEKVYPTAGRKTYAQAVAPPRRPTPQTPTFSKEEVEAMQEQHRATTTALEAQIYFLTKEVQKLHGMLADVLQENRVAKLQQVKRFEKIEEILQVQQARPADLPHKTKKNTDKKEENEEEIHDEEDEKDEENPPTPTPTPTPLNKKSPTISTGIPLPTRPLRSKTTSLTKGTGKKQ